MPHPAQLPVVDLLAQSEVTRTRRSGPGGQHRNKVETAVVIHHLPTGIKAEANERRSQELNRQVAIQRLRTKLALKLRTEPEDCQSPLWSSRAQEGKLTINPDHDDFPALLAEALDALATAEFDLPGTATRLGVTTSQFVKFLKSEPQAISLVNHERQSRGLNSYR
jgi:hypothetical protein